MPSHWAVVKSDLDNRCCRVAIHNCHLAPLLSHGKGQVTEKAGTMQRGLILALSRPSKTLCPRVSLGNVQCLHFLIATPLKRESRCEWIQVNSHHLGLQLHLPFSFSNTSVLRQNHTKWGRLPSVSFLGPSRLRRMSTLGATQCGR